MKTEPKTKQETKHSAYTASGETVMHDGFVMARCPGAHTAKQFAKAMNQRPLFAEMRDALEREAKSLDVDIGNLQHTAEQRAGFRARKKCLTDILAKVKESE
jgi:hypothetical protein